MNPLLPQPLHLTLSKAETAAQRGTSATANNATPASNGDEARLKEAAVQFEAVLVRQMLSCLEKVTSSPLGNQASGGSIYGSMVVNSVAEAVARAGGLGLSSLIVKSMQNQMAALGTHGVDSTTATPAATQDESLRGASSGSLDNEKVTSQRKVGELPP